MEITSLLVRKEYTIYLYISISAYIVYLPKSGSKVSVNDVSRRREGKYCASDRSSVQHPTMLSSPNDVVSRMHPHRAILLYYAQRPLSGPRREGIGYHTTCRFRDDIRNTSAVLLNQRRIRVHLCGCGQLRPLSGAAGVCMVFVTIYIYIYMVRCIYCLLDICISKR